MLVGCSRIKGLDKWDEMGQGNQGRMLQNQGRHQVEWRRVKRRGNGDRSERPTNWDYRYYSTLSKNSNSTRVLKV